MISNRFARFPCCPIKRRILHLRNDGTALKRGRLTIGGAYVGVATAAQPDTAAVRRNGMSVSSREPG